MVERWTTNVPGEPVPLCPALRTLMGVMPRCLPAPTGLHNQRWAARPTTPYTPATGYSIPFSLHSSLSPTRLPPGWSCDLSQEFRPWDLQAIGHAFDRPMTAVRYTAADTLPRVPIGIDRIRLGCFCSTTTRTHPEVQSTILWRISRVSRTRRW